jgi:simple sugar transport system permease protein
MNWKRVSFILVIIVLMFGVVVMVGRHEVAPLVIITSMLATTIAVATPITLGALSGIFCERVGVVNIGIEGMMLSATFFGWFAAVYVNTVLELGSLPSLFIGLAVAILTGGLMGLLHAVLSVTFKVDQIIGGRHQYRPSAYRLPGPPVLLEQGSVSAAQPYAPAPAFIKIHSCRIFHSWSFFDQRLVTMSAIVLVFVAHFVLFRTRWGLRTRSVGEHPRAADTVGINVSFMRYANVIIGGMLAGMGGAYFTLESVPKFEPMMTGGRGFIALAAMIFGNWSPIGAWMAAMVFGSAQALQINMQFFRASIPPQWAFLQNSYAVGVIPYLLTIIILTGVIGKTTPPAADGTPYEK